VLSFDESLPLLQPAICLVDSVLMTGTLDMGGGGDGGSGGLSSCTNSDEEDGRIVGLSSWIVSAVLVPAATGSRQAEGGEKYTSGVLKGMGRMGASEGGHWDIPMLEG
jgi:hypothetical protein